MKPALVVYFSRTGYTRRIASEIAKAIGADVEELREPSKRSGIFGYLRSAREALKGAAPELLPCEHDPRDYELVVFGTPVWASHVSSPLRSYVAAHRPDLRRVAFFCTEGGSGGGKVVRELADLCGQEPATALVLDDREIDGGRYATKLADFVRSIQPQKAA